MRLSAALLAVSLATVPAFAAKAKPYVVDLKTSDGKDAGTIRGAWYPYTFPFNLTGHPALSMPCGLTREGLPVGLQLVARWNEDRFLLEIAARLEEAIAFTARPRVFADA